MIYSVLLILGIFLGYFVAKFTKEELKSGLIYFNVLELIILILLPLLFLYYSFNWVLLISGIVLGIILRFEYLYFGFGIISSFFNINLSFLSSILVFIYGLPFGGIFYYKKKFRMLFFHTILFLIPFIFYLFKFNLLSFAAGGLLSLFVIKFGTFVKNFLR